MHHLHHRHRLRRRLRRHRHYHHHSHHHRHRDCQRHRDMNFKLLIHIFSVRYKTGCVNRLRLVDIPLESRLHTGARVTFVLLTDQSQIGTRKSYRHIGFRLLRLTLGDIQLSKVETCSSFCWTHFKLQRNILGMTLNSSDIVQGMTLELRSCLRFRACG